MLVGPDGVFMVDAQFAPLTDKIVAAIKQISDGRIRFLVNTHVHGDHTGGNENIGKLGVDDLRARESARAAAEAGAAGQRPAGRAGRRRSALPIVTYDAPITFHMNGEDVQLIPVPVAHTDGDTIVYFPNANVIMTGDFYRSTGYPNIDRANGGSLNGMLDGLRRDRRRWPARHEDRPGPRRDRRQDRASPRTRDDDRGARQGGGAGAPEQDAGRSRRREAHRRVRRARSPARRR